MEAGAINFADAAVIGFVLLSGVWGLARGFVREVLGIVAWVGAAFAAIYLHPYLVPYARQLITLDWVADPATYLVAFLIILILLSIVTGAISSRVKASSLGMLDRTLGFLFGLVRGAVLVCLAYLALTWAVKATDRPAWLAEARTLPLVERGAEFLSGLLPSNALDEAQRAAAETKRKADQAIEAKKAYDNLANPAAKGDAPRDGTGYKPDERRDLDKLFQGK